MTNLKIKKTKNVSLTIFLCILLYSQFSVSNFRNEAHPSMMDYGSLANSIQKSILKADKLDTDFSTNNFSALLNLTYATSSGIAIDNNGNSYITGTSYFRNNLSENLNYGTLEAIDGFVAKVNSNGELNFSSYLRGNSIDVGIAITVDLEGNSYVTGVTTSTDFPTKNAFNETFGGAEDIFLSKIDSKGETIFSTYIGGQLEEECSEIVLDSSGNSYITGYTKSNDFPTTENYGIVSNGSSNPFLMKFNSNGSLIFSNVFGGDSIAHGTAITVDTQGNVFIAGISKSLIFSPSTMYNTSNIEYTIFISKFNTTGEQLFTTYIGGNDLDYPTDIVISNKEMIFITGFTNSEDFYSFSGSERKFARKNDVFVTKLNSFGKLIFNTVFGGNEDEFSTGIAVDNMSNIYITGRTKSDNFPTKNEFKSNLEGTTDGFLTKLDTTGNFLFSTYIGGEDEDFISGIAIDEFNNCYMVGHTISFNSSEQEMNNKIFEGGLGVFAIKLNVQEFLSETTIDFASVIVIIGSLIVVLIIIGISSIEYRKYRKINSSGEKKKKNLLSVI